MSFVIQTGGPPFGLVVCGNMDWFVVLSGGESIDTVVPLWDLLYSDDKGVSVEHDSQGLDPCEVSGSSLGPCYDEVCVYFEVLV